jgi:hypothetical protein
MSDEPNEKVSKHTPAEIEEAARLFFKAERAESYSEYSFDTRLPKVQENYIRGAFAVLSYADSLHEAEVTGKPYLLSEHEIDTIIEHIEVYGASVISADAKLDPENSPDYWLKWLRLKLQEAINPNLREAEVTALKAELAEALKQLEDWKKALQDAVDRHFGSIHFEEFAAVSDSIKKITTALRNERIQKGKKE